METINEMQAFINDQQTMLEYTEMPSDARSNIESLIDEKKKKIEDFKKSKTESNTSILATEIRNLLDGCGVGFVAGDSYAPDRYQSNIDGVKNIRISSDGNIAVKVKSMVGKLLPEKIFVRGTIYYIYFIESRYFTREIDY